MAGGASPSGTGLLERESELARIEQTVAAVERGHGGVLVIQCTAGIGKSALLRAVCERATDQGLRTLTARASELERDFGFRRGSRAAGGTDRPYRRARAR
jgi:predicted ATPase